MVGIFNRLTEANGRRNWVHVCNQGILWVRCFTNGQKWNKKVVRTSRSSRKRWSRFCSFCKGLYIFEIFAYNKIQKPRKLWPLPHSVKKLLISPSDIWITLSVYWWRKSQPFRTFSASWTLSTTQFGIRLSPVWWWSPCFSTFSIGSARNGFAAQNTTIRLCMESFGSYTLRWSNKAQVWCLIQYFFFYCFRYVPCYYVFTNCYWRLVVFHSHYCFFLYRNRPFSFQVSKVPLLITLLELKWTFQCKKVSKANLAAFLTVTQMEKPIQSFQDLSLQTDMLYGTVSQTSIHDYLKLKANQVMGLSL